jgi:hypothetical protein
LGRHTKLLTSHDVEWAEEIQFFVNLKTAKQIGLAILPNVLARVDKVIK